ncbi:DUF3616 domain-containing protein [Roseisolibacter agri]|uniref:DUF3616 domain-containing protein n=1 Tax=Roseisolibacter agri TaxID=2014610 RepID=A0AA37QIB5_9BACT|nr:DUF3616 domain-containing protein [Roseisolibacter agri]GLC27030.1 hypothetical protein rosag_35430 [Roseisolibacter agri]
MGRQPRQVTLDFSGVAQSDAHAGAHLALSAVACVGDQLWFGADEGTALLRLTRVAPDRWADAVPVPLETLLTLPGDADDEIDVEGIDACDGWLWVTGSHGIRRRKPAKDAPDAERIARLARTSRRGNRHLVARLPLVAQDDAGRRHDVVRAVTAADGVVRRAARLPGTRTRDRLTAALRRDAHLAPFLDIPGKDNGFDVEGLAADGDRLWLGLRGPVLRGRAVVLAVTLDGDADDDTLRLRRASPDGRRYERFFLDLFGLGVRELCWHGDDLLVLAGPTMALGGRCVVVRWRGARRARGDAMVDRDALTVVHELPYGAGSDEGVEHPEGITIVPDASPALLVVHDAPGPRRVRDAVVLADAYPLD